VKLDGVYGGKPALIVRVDVAWPFVDRLTIAGLTVGIKPPGPYTKVLSVTVPLKLLMPWTVIVRLVTAPARIVTEGTETERVKSGGMTNSVREVELVKVPLVPVMVRR